MPEGRHRRSQRGFTLAEVLVATAVFAVIMIAALAVYDQGNQVFKKGSESSEMQESTRIGFDKLVSDLRMAGFDYNRGGIPQETGQYSQPDEQIEYAGTNVIAFRSNFNYNTASAGCTAGYTSTAPPCDNGLEPAYTPLVNSKPVFPYVTTSNDEIVIYALRSTDPNKNTNEISFWADTSQPRSAYPNSPTSGAEQQVILGPGTCGGCGIDTTGNNPPYTLYRITVSDVLAGRMGTPVAENIRTLRFFYYTDPNGASVLKDPNSTSNPPADLATTRNATSSDDVSNSATVTINGVPTPTGAIGGAGKYTIDSSGKVTADPNDPLDRNARATITSIRVDLIGLNSAPDGGYTNANETIAGLKHYRQYQLSALVAPRNLGLHGFPEQNFQQPGTPTITGICIGHCAAPVICWNAPTTGGPVLTYIIGFDTNPNGAFTNQYVIGDPSATSAILPDIYGIDPTKTWFFKVNAANNNGASPWADLNPVSAQPLNSTKPGPPAALAASTSNQGNQVPPNDAITVNWTAATNNDTSSNSLTCTGTCTADGTVIPTGGQETIRFKIYRGTKINFALTEGVAILDNTMAQNAVAPGGNGTFVDSADTSKYAPGNCVQYYYRIQEMDRCITSDKWNASGSAAQATSTEFPAVGTNAMPGMAWDGGIQASGVSALNVDTSKSSCAQGASKTCTIVLTWPQVTTDTKGNHIGVDRYMITRMRKHNGDPGGYQLDTTFGNCGQLTMGGFSSNNSGTAGYTDTAPAFDSCGDPGCAWYYQYVVQPSDCRISWTCPGGGSQNASAVKDFYTGATCGTYVGDISCLPKAQYPSPCNQPSATVTSTALSTDAGGCLIFNGGDSITVTAANTSLKFQSVQVFVNGTSPTLTVKSCGTLDCATWTEAGLQQAVDTPVSFVITYTNGCTEVQNLCVQDAGAAKCFFTATEAPPYTTEQPKTLNTGGSTTTVTETYNVTNNTANVPGNTQFKTDSLSFAGQSFTVTYTIPTGFSDIVLSQIVFGGSQNVTVPANQITCASGTCTFTGSAPAGLSPLAPGATLPVAVKWTYKKTDGTLSAALLQKLCLGYLLSTTSAGFSQDKVDPSVHHCDVLDLLGLGSGNNPTSCN